MAEQQIKRVSLHRPQLMADLDVEYWVNLPRDTLEHLMTDRFPRRERIWACIILHSYGHEYLSPFCQRIVNGRRQEMRKVDIARELDIDKAGVSREFARFETDGLVRTEGKRIYPCPKPVPRSRGRKVVRTDNFLDGNVSLRAEYELELAKLEKLYKAELAAAARAVRAAHRERKAKLAAEYLKRARNSEPAYSENNPARVEVRTDNGSGPTVVRADSTLDKDKKKSDTHSPSECVNTSSGGSQPHSPTPPKPAADPKAEAIRELLVRIVEPKLGFPPDANLCAGVVKRLGDAPVSHLAARISSRLPAVKTYGLVLDLAADCAKAFRESQDQQISVQARREEVARRDREEQAAEARRRLADPFLDADERQFWIEQFPELADWRPSQKEMRAALVPSVRSAIIVRERDLSPARARSEAQDYLDQVEARFPGIVAEIQSEQVASPSAGAV